ncbi:hypothetical protein QCA50_004202 [Cerrena zonata]|uniref:Ribosomal protein S5 domain 2-like protein n=1 Tax=Cerrena zonata TaxID=2478898 RepID=A0AAW0GIT1_9APHY
MFNVLRQQARIPLRRAYATQGYVPPASANHIAPSMMPRFKPRPDTPTFYTGLPSYFESVNKLESAITTSRSILQNLQLLPLPKFARDTLPDSTPVWKTKDEMGTQVETKLTTARYRRLVGLLTQLEDYHKIAHTAGCADVAEGIADVIELFQKDNRAAVLAGGKRKPVQFDKYGRSYTIGRRKESHARVWMIPVQTKASSPATPLPLAPEVNELQTDTTAPNLTPFLPPKPLVEAKETVEVTSTNILINNVPLVQYFPHNADRERIIRSFKLTGLIGAYNVFALVRGGGTTGQSGAVALGIAKGLGAHAPEVQSLLKKAKLLRRDPRMVERKKTGRRKARKAFTWVRR